MRFNSFQWCLWLALGLAASGCQFLSSREREYRSNLEVLALAEQATGYIVDRNVYALEALDLRDDSVTYHYRGVASPGDHAWVVRFSQKSSEQDPPAVVDVYGLLPVVREGKSGFAITTEGEVEVGGVQLKRVAYRFESPIHDNEGKPLPGNGILASFKVNGGPAPVVFHVKLDNHGDRAGVEPRLLLPFLEAALRG